MIVLSNERCMQVPFQFEKNLLPVVLMKRTNTENFNYWWPNGDVKQLTTGPEGNSEFCFPRIRGKQNSLFSKGPVIKWFVIKQNKTKANFEKRSEILATTSGHFQLHALITCNSGQHFTGNSELFPVWCHSFRNVARSWRLAGNSFMSDVMWSWTSQWRGVL